MRVRADRVFRRCSCSTHAGSTGASADWKGQQPTLAGPDIQSWPGSRRANFLYLHRRPSWRRHTRPHTSRPVMDRLGIKIVQTCQKRAQAGVVFNLLGPTWFDTVICHSRGIAALSHYSQWLVPGNKLRILSWTSSLRVNSGTLFIEPPLTSRGWRASWRSARD